MGTNNKNIPGRGGRLPGIRFKAMVAAMLLPLLVLGGCTSTTTELRLEAKSEIIKSSERYQKKYVLQAGDQIEVFVYRHPDFSKTGTVRPDGYVTIPVLDDIQAAGLTSSELDDVITELLSQRLVDPEVTVFIDNTQEPMVYVIGEVIGPQAVPLRHARTAAEAIVLAGGMRFTADSNAIAVIRLDDDGYLSATTVEKMESQPGYLMALQNMPLRQDDVLLVPEGARSQVGRAINDYITEPLGAVNQILTPYFQFELLNEIQKSNND